MTRKQSVVTREHVFAAVFFSLLLLLLYQAGRIAATFLWALLWASIISLALHPAYQRVLAALKGRASLAAGAMTLLTIAVIIGPAVAVLAALASQAVDLYRWAIELVQSGRLAEFWERFTQTPLGAAAGGVLDLQGIKGGLVGGFGELSSNMAEQIGALLKNTLLLFVNLAVMILSLFFFFRDGESYARSVMAVLPFTQKQKLAISRKFLDTFSAVINGVFIIAIVQGIMAGAGFAVFGIPFAVFWGFLAAVLALLPVGGAALVWAPAAAWLLLTDSTLNGVLLALWGAVLVSLPDNFLKPLIIGKKAKLPTFLLFIGILGGIRAYGILGILFGPVVVTLLMAFVKIYREEFAAK